MNENINKFDGGRQQLLACLGAALAVGGALSAVTTSRYAGLIAVGGGLAVATWALRQLLRRSRERYRVLPTILIVTIGASTLLLSLFLYHRENAYLDALVTEQTELIESKLKFEISELSNALRRYATRVDYLGLNDKGFLRADGKSYLAQIKGLRRLGIVNKELRVIWSYPDEIAYQVKNFNQALDPSRRESFVDAVTEQRPSFSRLIQLRSGERGFLVPVPLTKGQSAGGFLYGTVSAAALITNAVSDVDMHVTVRERQQTILANQADADIFDNQVTGVERFAHQTIFMAGIANWTIEVTPTARFVGRHRSYLPLFVGVVGVLLAGLIGGIVQTAARSLAQNEFDSIWRNAVLNGAEYSIISTDVDGSIQTFNRAAELLLGYDAAEVINRVTPEVFHRPDEITQRARELGVDPAVTSGSGYETLITGARLNGAADRRTWTYVRKDGSHVPVALSISPLRSTTGEILGYIGIAVDLTERRAQEVRLGESMDRLERVIDSTGSGIWERDLTAAAPNYFDARGKALLGFAADAEVSYEQVLARIDPEDREALSRRVREHVDGLTTRIEIEMRVHPHGSENVRWLRVIGRVKAVDGSPQTLTMTFNDVTTEIDNRRRLETALKEARSATEAKSAFVANMSHEIRTPLAGILGLTRLVQQTTLTFDQRENLDSVVRSGEHLLTIINDILDFAKIDAGKMDLENIPFDLARLLEDTTKVLGYSARQKNIGLTLDAPPNLNAKFRGDPGRLGQILINLISNAIKFTHQGRVTLRVKQLVVKRDVYRLRFEVQDTGIGLSPDSMSRMFQAFSQADISTTRRFGGTGLGLSISKRLVDLMGGTIGVHSEINRGSTFWFEVPLPIDQTPEDEVIERPTVVKTSFPARILIAEDNVINQKVAVATLKKLGYQPEVVGNGQEAVTALETNQYDLVLMDCQMPVLDGYEATRTLRLNVARGLDKIPVIAMTAHVMAGEREKCLEAGMSDYITKPFDVRTLHALIERHLAA